MNNSKYRTFDNTTNIIISTKNLQGQYVSYRNGRNTSQKSFKKTPLQTNFNRRVFQKATMRTRVLSKNDRLDLYLQGGHFSNSRQPQTLPIDSRLYFKGLKIKRKDLFSTTKPNKTIRKLEAPLPYQSTHSETFSSTILQQQRFILVKIPKCHLNDNAQPWVQKNIVYSEQKIKIQSNEDREQPRRRVMKRQSMGPRLSIRNIEPKSASPIKDTSSKARLSGKDEESSSPTRNKPLFYFNQKQLNCIKAESFIVTEYPSRKILTGNYYKKFAQIASLTKIMTCYCVIRIATEENLDIDLQTIQIDEEVQQITGTSAELIAGDVYTVRSLLYGLMLPSGNDAATALAKWGGCQLQRKKSISESQKDSTISFISFMNACAKQLNLKSTRFFNPHGLPHSQSGSTPQELAMLVHQCLNFQLFREIVKTHKFSCHTINQGVRREVVWQNTHKLLRRKGFVGVKTGVTVTAGPCLATCYQSHNKYFVVILLRTTKLSRRFKETRIILGMALNKLDFNTYRRQAQQILREDKQLDSDNSEDEMEFAFDKKDAQQMAKRNKILTFQM